IVVVSVGGRSVKVVICALPLYKAAQGDTAVPSVEAQEAVERLCHAGGWIDPKDGSKQMNPAVSCRAIKVAVSCLNEHGYGVRAVHGAPPHKPGKAVQCRE